MLSIHRYCCSSSSLLVVLKALLMLSVLICDILAVEEVCSKDDVVITNNRNQNGTVFYDARKERTRNCGCAPSTCIPKCCKFGYYMKRKVCYQNSVQNDFKVPVFAARTKFLENYTDPEKFLIGIMKCAHFFPLNHSNPKETFYIQNDGRLWVPKESDYYKKKDGNDGSYYANNAFCVDERNGYMAFLCTETPEEDLVVEVGMLISMPFLAVTFLVYLILPEKNLHRKGLMIYVMTLLLAYISLVSIQLNRSDLSLFFCNFIGYVIMFFFISSFIWMNVMCIDMWLTFSGNRGFGSRRSSEHKRFIYYCLYGFGTPLLHTIIVYLVNTYGDKDSIFHPQLANGKCFLGDGYPNLFYFYGPIGFLITINITLFVLTAIRIQKVKRETKMLKHSDSKRHSYENDKQKFNLYLKLLFAMGVNWTLEVISWAFLWRMPDKVPAAVWYIPDFANAIYGVFIFFIFVFKRKIWNSLKKRYYIFMGKPLLAQAVTRSSHSTRTSHVSTTDANLNDRHQEQKSLRTDNRKTSMK